MVHLQQRMKRVTEVLSSRTVGQWYGHVHALASAKPIISVIGSAEVLMENILTPTLLYFFMKAAPCVNLRPASYATQE
jgi:hypothetical protein